MEHEFTFIIRDILEKHFGTDAEAVRQSKVVDIFDEILLQSDVEFNFENK